MIHSICGLQNSGKSLIASWFAFIDFIQGRKIVSNIHLNFPHYLINKEFLNYLAKNQPHITNVSFLLDECWIWYDAYAAIQEKLGSYFFLQSSKDDSNIYLTAQNNDQNLRRVRQNLHRYTECKRVIKVNDKYKDIFIEKRDLSNYRTKNNIPYNDILYIHAMNFKRVLDNNGLRFNFASNLYLRAQPYFKLYNTYEKRSIK